MIYRALPIWLTTLVLCFLSCSSAHSKATWVKLPEIGLSFALPDSYRPTVHARETPPHYEYNWSKADSVVRTALALTSSPCPDGNLPSDVADRAFRGIIPSSKVVSRGQIKILNVPGYYTISEYYPSGSKVSHRLRCTGFAYNRRIYLFMFSTGKQQYSKEEGQFIGMLKSLRWLPPPDSRGGSSPTSINRPDAGITLSIPSRYSPEPIPQNLKPVPGQKILFNGAREGWKDIYHTHIFISAYFGGKGTETSLHDRCKDVIASMQSRFPSYKYTDSRILSIDGVRAYLVTGRHNHSSRRGQCVVERRCYQVVRDDVLYTITLSAEVNAMPSEDKAFQQVLRSIRWLPLKAAR